MTHPRLEYLLVACVAAAVTFLLTPLARRLAIRVKAIALPRDRDVHAVAIPRGGGVALFLGFAVALFVASKLPTLHQAFDTGPNMPWVVFSAGLICLIGVLDDKYELDSLTKLAGQVLATGVMVTLGGVQLGNIPIPFGGGGSLVLGQDLAIPVTILLTVLTINAMNFIDGLDGLAAGVTVIAASGFFMFSYHLAQGDYLPPAAPSTLLAAVLVGTCLGFLPHNFFPARVFMGDSGSMMVGLVLAAAATTATTTADPQVFNRGQVALPLLIPLLPLAVLALPFADLLLAVVRRLRKGRSPFAPDKQHLHHRLLELGHSHRRAVLLLYFWSALLAFAGVGLSYTNGTWLVIWTLCALVGIGLLVSIVPVLRRRSGRHRAVVARGSRLPPPPPVGVGGGESGYPPRPRAQAPKSAR